MTHMLLKCTMVCAMLIAEASFAFASSFSDCVVNEVFYAKNRETKTTKFINSEFGQITVMVNSLSRERDGAEIGIAIIRTINLGLESLTPGPGGMYDSVATVFLPEGTFAVSTISDYDKDKISKKLQRAVLGGTGKYAGARGVVVIEPIENTERSEHKATFKGLVFCDYQ